jgi:hypothetical protein
MVVKKVNCQDKDLTLIFPLIFRTNIDTTHTTVTVRAANLKNSQCVGITENQLTL